MGELFIYPGPGIYSQARARATTTSRRPRCSRIERSPSSTGWADRGSSRHSRVSGAGEWGAERGWRVQPAEVGRVVGREDRAAPVLTAHAPTGRSARCLVPVARRTEHETRPPVADRHLSLPVHDMVVVGARGEWGRRGSHWSVARTRTLGLDARTSTLSPSGSGPLRATAREAMPQSRSVRRAEPAAKRVVDSRNRGRGHRGLHPMRRRSASRAGRESNPQPSDP